MNHLLICREYPPAPSGGGIGTYTLHMAELLAAGGETVHVIGQRWPGAPKALETRLGGRLMVHRVAVEDGRPDADVSALAEPVTLDAFRDPSVSSGFMWAAGGLAESLIDSAGIDLVEAPEYEAPTAAMMLRRSLGLGPTRHVPLLIHLHTPSEFVFRANGWLTDLAAHSAAIQLEGAVIRAADAWLSPSRFLAGIAGAHYRLPDQGVHVIPYPLGDTDRIDRDERTWREGAICYVGRLEPRKGVIEWIDAATAVARSSPGQFTLIGRDTAPAFEPGGSVRKLLMAKIPPGQRARFTFIDAVARHELNGHLAQARIAVIPSRWENFPNACVEAMASGLPALVSPDGGMAEMVEDGKTGWIAEGSDSASLTRALERALATPPATLADMGAAAALSIRRLCDNGEIVRRQLEWRRQIVMVGCRPSSDVASAFQVAEVAAGAGERPVADERLAQGRTMSFVDVLRAPSEQRKAVVRRALDNPRYVGQWLAWHGRRSMGKLTSGLSRWRSGAGKALFVLCLVVSGGSVAASGPGSSSAGVVATRSYEAIDDDVVNPERGFYRQFTPFWLGTERFPLEAAALNRLREEGISLVRAYFVIDEFRDAPLSAESLDAINANFVAVRDAGLKIIPRFSYNFPTLATYRQAVDAPLDRILQHIDQLQPILRANADVIAFMEVGFVGAWGEWHTSSNGLLDPGRGISKRSSAIVKRLLRVLPKQRMLALRYPYYKQQLFGTRPISPERAFKGSAQARIGAHNDCFASGETNGGTYSPPPSVAKDVASLKAYLSEDNRFVVQGGESCGTDVVSDVRSDSYAHCESALADLAMMRWSTLNVSYHPDVLELWRHEGCLDEVRRRLGYRFRLVEETVSHSVARGGRFSVQLTIANDGWATPYNPRAVEIVLRGRTDRRLLRLPVKADPRRWMAGATHVLVLQKSLPRNLPAGDYDVFVNFPDPEKSLYGRPEYSLGLANAEWETTTGFNKLRSVVTISIANSD